MSLYQIRARQGPHIKTYLISWQLFGPKISLEIHCWPITTFFKTVGENFSQCQIVLFCMMVSNCPILHDGVKLSQVSNCPLCLHGVKLSYLPLWCQIVRSVKLSQVSNCPRILYLTKSLRSLMKNLVVIFQRSRPSFLPTGRFRFLLCLLFLLFHRLIDKMCKDFQSGSPTDMYLDV